LTNGLLVLIGDLATNAVREAARRRNALAAELATDRSAPRASAVNTFASNARAALRAVASPRAGPSAKWSWSAGDGTRQSIARDTGYLDGLQDFRGMDVSAICAGKVVALSTGSHGEAARRASPASPPTSLSRGGLSRANRVIFSSRPIFAGNEKGDRPLIHGLIDRASSQSPTATHRVHVSAPRLRCRREAMIGWVQASAPSFRCMRAAAIFPIHARAVRGRLWRIPSLPQRDLVAASAPRAPDIIDEVPAGRLYKDGILLSRPTRDGG